MDFGMDATDIMKRRGGVYPWVKSAGLGYFFGHADTVPIGRADTGTVCDQVNENSHTHSMFYKGQAISDSQVRD